MKRTRKKRNTRVEPTQSFRFPWKLVKWVALPLLMAGLVLYGQHWISKRSNLMITSVEVLGDLTYADREAIQSIIKPFVKTNLYLMDAQILEEELEFEPWIREVAITKRWPREVVVRITEQTPVAFWGDDRMLNHKGEIFDVSLPSQRGVMPILYNPEDNGLEMIRQYKMIQQWLKTAPVGVTEFIVNARGSWQIRLTNGWLIEVGKMEQKKRIRRFLVAYEKTLIDKADQVKKIDLRYANGLAVSWK